MIWAGRASGGGHAASEATLFVSSDHGKGPSVGRVHVTGGKSGFATFRCVGIIIGYILERL